MTTHQEASAANATPASEKRTYDTPSVFGSGKWREYGQRISVGAFKGRVWLHVYANRKFGKGVKSVKVESIPIDDDNAQLLLRLVSGAMVEAEEQNAEWRSKRPSRDDEFETAAERMERVEERRGNAPAAPMTARQAVDALNGAERAELARLLTEQADREIAAASRQYQDDPELAAARRQGE
ncbi:MAG: hypothetical protein HYT80_00480 [Euryarchaeota archaeon]|nr:hypothetical protein [Euryarchaeota archaeon]